MFAIFCHDSNVEGRLGIEKVVRLNFTTVCCCCPPGNSPAQVTEEGRFPSSCFGYVCCTGVYLTLYLVGNELFTLSQCFLVIEEKCCVFLFFAKDQCLRDIMEEFVPCSEIVRY